MKKTVLQTAPAVLIGAAVTFALMYFTAMLPPDVSLGLAVAVAASFAAVFGPAAGLLIALVGCTLNDLVTAQGVFWSWAIASGLFGCLAGCLRSRLGILKGKFGAEEIALFNIAQIAANIIAWIAAAPLLDILFYGEPANRMIFLHGLKTARTCAVITAVLGTAICFVWSFIQRRRIKTSELSPDIHMTED